jgi:hypothetical protein
MKIFIFKFYENHIALRHFSISHKARIMGKKIKHVQYVQRTFMYHKSKPTQKEYWKDDMTPEKKQRKTRLRKTDVKHSSF